MARSHAESLCQEIYVTEGFYFGVFMKQIKLTQGKFAIVDDDDYEWINRWKWYLKNSGYAVRSLIAIEDGVKRSFTIGMHREINRTPKGLMTDHINGEKLDNRKQNLRNATPGQNQRNKPMLRNNKSGYRGVHTTKPKWIARIRLNGKDIYLGNFENEVDAAEVYDIAAYHLHGEFASFNFKNGENNQ